LRRVLPFLNTHNSRRRRGDLIHRRFRVRNDFRRRHLRLRPVRERGRAAFRRHRGTPRAFRPRDAGWSPGSQPPPAPPFGGRWESRRMTAARPNGAGEPGRTV